MLEALRSSATTSTLDQASIARVLGFARSHLRMDLAWISRISDGREVIEFLDGEAAAFGLALGASPRTDLGARAGIAANVGVPLLTSNGATYGMLSCLNRQPRPFLQTRDAEFLELVAALITPSLVERDGTRVRDAQAGARIQRLLDGGGPTMAYQPIFALPTRRMIAVEALARFPVGHGGPEQWFSDAADAGLALELELAAVSNALMVLAHLDDTIAVSINVSAETAVNRGLYDRLDGYNTDRVIVEITEHHHVADYRRLRASCERLRALGCRVAIDDTGVGYAGFQHLIEVQPDIIKLDHQITNNLDGDPARAAMATALVGFARAIGASVLAECIETSGELAAAVALDIDFAQGFHLARPQTLREIAGRRLVVVDG